MKKLNFLIIGIIISTSTCFSQALDRNILLNHLKSLSADSLEGRGYGAEGGLKARNYIEKNFRSLGLEPAFEGSFIQKFNSSRNEKELEGANVIGVIRGISDEIIIITAHYDHLGIKNGNIYNGADDNASGAAALFSIGSHFLKNKPYHTLILAAVDAEEVGSIGAQYLLENFPMDTANIKLNINLDMVGHNEKNELYASGTFHYPQLKAPLEQVDSPIDLKFGHDSPEYIGADNWTYASDHRVFHRKNIPFIYFGVEDHEDYHKPSDTYENINKDFYVNAVDFIIKAIRQYDKSLME